MNAAAVRMANSSSSTVVAPSQRPLMVRVATRMQSTPSSPALQRSTRRTILVTSTGSRLPSRLRTRMGELKPSRLSGTAVSSAGRAPSPLGCGPAGTLVLSVLTCSTTVTPLPPSSRPVRRAGVTARDVKSGNTRTCSCRIVICPVLPSKLGDESGTNRLFRGASRWPLSGRRSSGAALGTPHRAPRGRVSGLLGFRPRCDRPPGRRPGRPSPRHRQGRGSRARRLRRTLGSAGAAAA